VKSVAQKKAFCPKGVEENKHGKCEKIEITKAQAVCPKGAQLYQDECKITHIIPAQKHMTHPASKKFR